MRIRKPIERWFPAPEDPDKAEVKIRHLTPGERQDISDQILSQDISYEQDAEGKLKPIMKSRTDSKADREKKLIARLVDWKNMFDEDGQPMECTPENIIKASRKIEGFLDFVLERAKILEDDIIAEAKIQEKN